MNNMQNERPTVQVPIYNRCWCCSLQLGCYIVGSFLLAISLIQIGVLSFLVGFPLPDVPDYPGFLVVSDIVLDVAIGVSVLEFINYFVLILGTSLKRQALLKIFVVLNGIFLGLTALLMIFFLIMGMYPILIYIGVLVIRLDICFMAHSHSIEIYNASYKTLHDGTASFRNLEEQA